MDAAIGRVDGPAIVPVPASGIAGHLLMAPGHLRVALAGVVVFAVALLGLLLAMELRLSTTQSDLAAVQRSIGGTAAAHGSPSPSILGEMGDLGQVRTQVAAMTAQVDQLAGVLRGLSAGGSGLAAVPGLSAQLAVLGHQLSAFDGQLSGVTSAVAPLSSIEQSLQSLQGTVAALQRALAPAPSLAGSGGG